MKPMLPTYSEAAPVGDQWVYEPKYDGFRGILFIGDGDFSLKSRNEKELLPLFPEIEEYIVTLLPKLKPFLPIQLDGEVVWLENEYKADFQQIQWRGRLRNSTAITKAASQSPCRFLAFDLLLYQGTDMKNASYTIRKNKLMKLCTEITCPLTPDPLSLSAIQYVPETSKLSDLQEKIILYDGEGLVAKNINKPWEEATRTPAWIKIKNWRTVHCFITSLNQENGYFSLGVYKDDLVVSIGQVKHGLSPNDYQILQQVIKQNAYLIEGSTLFIHPSICAAVHFLHVYKENELREPQFSHLLIDAIPSDCRWDLFVSAQYTFPHHIPVTSPDKPIWKLSDGVFTKIDYLQYLRKMSSYLLPHLVDKPLTTIRFPHGTMKSERFFQKNVPDYAPKFIKTFQQEEHEFILCNSLETLIWLGNQLSLEFHIPFQTAGKLHPDELVLDLDPPAPALFILAVKAATEIKKVLDPLGIKAFVKTSGNKGLQVHIPLLANTFTYDDTRVFTQFLGSYLTSTFPEDFTTERMIKKRQGRLYLDFVQHHEGKTIIAPYSTRGNEFAGVATPLYWEELEEKNIKIHDFTVLTVPGRIKQYGCPFSSYNLVRDQQPLHEVIDFIKKNQ